MTKKVIFMLAIIVLGTVLGAYVVSLLEGTVSLIPLLVGFSIFEYGVFYLSFVLYDKLYPAPSGLTSGEVKAFFMSKVFWLAFITFLFTILNGLFNLGLDAETAETIMNLDWTNLLPAFLSVLVIILRKIDVFKFLV